MRKRRPNHSTQGRKDTPRVTAPEQAPAPRPEDGEELIPPLPEDHPLYTQGWVIGQTFRGWSPAEARRIANKLKGKP